jgi:hypothetical protein
VRTPLPSCWLAPIVFVAGCGVSGGARLAPPPEADPEFPLGYVQWTVAGPVSDDTHGTLRTLYREPGTAAARRYVKVHLDPRDAAVTTRIDLRQPDEGGALDGWAYYSFDAATRSRLVIDAETCHLCHAAAGADGVFTRFK